MNTPVNVLCLHGCNQTQAMFEGLLKNFMKLGEKQYNLKFHFTEAKYDHPVGGKTWYNKPLNVPEIGSIPYDHDLVIDTLTDISEIIKKENINVLLGFSQGANVVDTFLSHMNLEDHPTIKRAVLFSGYSLVDENRKDINVPALTIISEIDDIVPHKFNPTGYKEMQVLKHDKGHKLPTQNPQIRQICNFMQKI